MPDPSRAYAFAAFRAASNTSRAEVVPATCSVPAMPRSIQPAFTASNISSAGPERPFGMPNCSNASGPIRDETLIARPLGLLRMVNAASPAYLARYGVPRSLEDLQRQEHRTIHFSTMLGARPHGWEYPDGDSYATLQLPGALHVNNAQTYEAAALAGLGLIQAPLLGIGRYLESGALVEIIPDFRRRPLTVSLVVAHRSNLSRRVRAFMKWIEDVLTPHLE